MDVREIEDIHDCLVSPCSKDASQSLTCSLEALDVGQDDSYQSNIEIRPLATLASAYIVHYSATEASRARLSDRMFEMGERQNLIRRLQEAMRSPMGPMYQLCPSNNPKFKRCLIAQVLAGITEL